MNNELERYLIIILLLVLIGLSGCVQKTISPTVIEPEEEKPSTITDSIGKMEGIANALGCMFAPETCKAKDTDK